MKSSIIRSPRHRAAHVTVALALVGGSGVAFAGAAHADPNPNVTICHATGSTQNPFTVITIDAAAITSAGHDVHQNDRDVIPPFTYVAENSGETVTFEGQNWHDNWATNGEGVADDPDSVDRAACTGTDETVPPKPSETPTGSTTPTPTGTPTSTPTRPVVQTDGLRGQGPQPGLVLGGTALAVAAAAVLHLARRRGSHS